MEFMAREGKEFKNCRPSGQRLVDSRHQMKIAGAGKHIHPRLVDVIDMRLKVGEQRGHTLCLINDHAVVECLDKAIWIV